MLTGQVSLQEAFAEYAEESLQLARDAWAIRPALGSCVCMQPWSSVTGRTCPAHGYIAPLQVTC